MFFKRNKFQIVCFGSAVADVFLFSREFKLSGLGGGWPKETVICSLYGGKTEMDRRRLTSGGGGTNAAVGFARLGFKTAVVARLGDDVFGRMVVADLAKESGLDTSWLAVKKNEETDSSVVLVGPDGGRSILVYRGKTRLEKADVPWGKLAADWFYIASLEGNLALAAELLDFARKKGIKTAWNPGGEEISQKKKILSLLPWANLVIFNREEAGSLWGGRPEKTNIPMLAITQGKKGATMFAEGKKIHQPIFKTAVVEETGAGDGFGCGLVAGLAKGLDFQRSLAWGLANAAGVVSKTGAKAGLLTEKEVAKIVEKRK